METAFIREPLPRTQSLAMPEAVHASMRVRNLNVCGHVNKFHRIVLLENSTPCQRCNLQ